ncbi:MAG: hypothetical protein CL878_07370 [Dehalococcoidia bacterium]|nr:hypothetical protein [Dehalococcoidia bacterium]
MKRATTVVDEEYSHKEPHTGTSRDALEYALAEAQVALEGLVTHAAHARHSRNRQAESSLVTGVRATGARVSALTSTLHRMPLLEHDLAESSVVFEGLVGQFSRARHEGRPDAEAAIGAAMQVAAEQVQAISATLHKPRA